MHGYRLCGWVRKCMYVGVCTMCIHVVSLPAQTLQVVVLPASVSARGMVHLATWPVCEAPPTRHAMDPAQCTSLTSTWAVTYECFTLSPLQMPQSWAHCHPLHPSSLSRCQILLPPPTSPAASSMWSHWLQSHICSFPLVSQTPYLTQALLCWGYRHLTAEVI